MLSHALVVLSVALSVQEVSPPSIRDLLMVQGISEQIIVTDDSQIDPSALLSGSDLVLRGVVRGRNDRLSGDARTVLTDYAVEVVDAIHPQTGLLKQRDVVTVQRRGGSVNISGRTFVARESGFPAFTIGEEYFLFLRRIAPDVHVVVGGAQGAYRISLGSVQMFNGRASDPEVPVTEFTRGLRAELERQPGG